MNFTDLLIKIFHSLTMDYLCYKFIKSLFFAYISLVMVQMCYIPLGMYLSRASDPFYCIKVNGRNLKCKKRSVCSASWTLQFEVMALISWAGETLPPGSGRKVANFSMNLLQDEYPCWPFGTPQFCSPTSIQFPRKGGSDLKILKIGTKGRSMEPPLYVSWASWVIYFICICHSRTFSIVHYNEFF